MNPSPYTGPYDSVLLNEIHRLFPALLYNPENYRTYYDVSNYIQSQMRGRYDIFSNTRNQYLSNSIDMNLSPPPQRPRRRPVPPSAPGSSAPAAANARPVRSAPPRNQENPRVIRTPPRQLNPPSRTTHVSPIMTYINPNGGPPQTYEEQIMDLLNVISMPFNTTATLRIPLSSTFEEPVVVRPTQLEIVEHTHLATIIADVDDVCSICQEQYQPQTQVRVINHCSHRFHTRCIDEWFQRNVHCPVCRHDIRQNESTPAE